MHALLAVLACIPLTKPAPTEAPPRWSGTAGFSFLQSSGNTENKSVGGEVGLVFQHKPWKVELGGDYLKMEANQSVSWDRLNMALAGERVIHDGLSCYTKGAYRRDPLVSVPRRKTLEAGGIYQLIATARNILKVSEALAETYEQRDQELGNRSFLGNRTGFGFAHKLNDENQFSISANYLYDFSDRRDWQMESEIALLFPVHRMVQVEFAHELSHTNLPTPGKRATDTKIAVSLKVKWPPSAKKDEDE